MPEESSLDKSLTITLSRAEREAVNHFLKEIKRSAPLYEYEYKAIESFLTKLES